LAWPASIAGEKSRFRTVSKTFGRLALFAARRALTARRTLVAFGAGFTRLAGFARFAGDILTRFARLSGLARFIPLAAFAFSAGAALAVRTEAVAAIAATAAEFVVAFGAGFARAVIAAVAAVSAIVAIGMLLASDLTFRLLAAFAGLLLGAGFNFFGRLVVVEIGIVAEPLVAMLDSDRLVRRLAGAQDAIVVLGVLEIAFRHHAIAGRVRIAR